MATKAKADENVTAEEIKNTIIEYHDETGFVPRGPSWERDTKYTLDDVYNHFDSLIDAITSAGLNVSDRRSGREVSKREVKRDIIRVWKEEGAVPTAPKYHEKGHFSSHTAYDKLGGEPSEEKTKWKTVLERVGIDEEPSYAHKGRGIKVQCYKCERICRTKKDQTTCPDCNANISSERGRITFFKTYEPVPKLSESPKPASEVGRIPDLLREVVDTLPVPRSSVQNIKWDGRSTAEDVKYLLGDERRAVDVFIEENKEYVEAALEHGTSNPFSHSWPEELYILLKQQYYWNHQ